MQKADRWLTAALVMAALLAGTVLGPPVVQAATTGIVTIQGAGSSHRAKVGSTGQLSVNPNLARTSAGQVEVAPADPGKAHVPAGAISRLPSARPTVRH